MAKGKKSIKVEIQLNAERFKSKLIQVANMKAEAADQAREASETSKEYCEANSIMPKVFATIVWLRNQDAMKAQSFMEQLVLLVDVAGVYDQGDLFRRAEERGERDIADPSKTPEVRAEKAVAAMPLDEAEAKFEKARVKNPPALVVDNDEQSGKAQLPH